MDDFSGCGLVDSNTGTRGALNLGKFSTVLQAEWATTLECTAGLERSG